MVRRHVIWVRHDAPAVEAVDVRLGRDALRASGVAVAGGAVPFRLDYELETRPGWRTRRLHAVSRGEGWWRELLLERTARGAWSVQAGAHGRVGLPAAGGPSGALAGALDCDLGGSPLTNSMPVLRHGLLSAPGAIDLLVAFVDVPSLRVTPALQRYSHVGTDGRTAFVQYLSPDSGFTAELVFDADGIVIEYPGLARRA
jgi:uncharacterized protein